MNARVSIIISGPFVNDPTTIDLLLARIPDDRNGVPPLIVEASMFTPRIFLITLISSSSVSGCTTPPVGDVAITAPT